MIPELTLTEYQLTYPAVDVISREDDSVEAIYRLSFIGAMISRYLTVTDTQDQPAYFPMKVGNRDVELPVPTQDDLHERTFDTQVDLSVLEVMGPYMKLTGLDSAHALSNMVILGKETHVVCLGRVRPQLWISTITVPRRLDANAPIGQLMAEMLSS